MAIDFNKKPSKKLPINLLINIGIAVGSILFFVIAWVLTINPKKITMANLEKKAKIMSVITDTQISTLKQDKVTLTTTKDDVAGKIASLKNGLIEEKNISTLMERFALNARKRNLTFSSIRPSMPETITVQEDEKSRGKDPAILLKMEKTSIALELEAGFFDFLGFLWDTEHVDQYLKTADLSIETNPQKGALRKERLTLNVYRLLEDKK
ncbi:MAG: hypothetical protein WC412_03760 [Candidatus Omnitrophota bacterium]|jgi:hypothetical protein